MKFKRFWFTTPLAVAAPMSVVACGRDVETEAKIQQDKMLSNDKVKTVAEYLWVENVLLNSYKSQNADNSKLVDLFNDSNSQFYKDAYAAFKIYANSNLENNAIFFLDKYSTWNNEGIFTSEETELIQSESVIKKVPSEELFKVLYKNYSTGISTEINKFLLVLKYFEISDSESLKVLDSNYSTNSNNYTEKYYNLIAYVLNKKPIQYWEYSNSNADALFAWTQKTLNGIDQYQKMISTTYDSIKKAYTENLIKANSEIDSQLGGYKGIAINKASTYNLDYSLSTLKSLKASALSGFYSNDKNNNNLILVNSEGKLEKSLSLYDNSNKKINATYINMIAPIGVEVTTGEGENQTKTTKLTFDGTGYENSLNLLVFNLLSVDSTLFSSAVSAFKKLGYKLEATNTIVADKLKGSDFI
ncbi:hypothetical protein C4M96_02125 [Mycoplasmopsis pullorum]|uniref:HinT-interacting membrane complex lipoprotein P60 n=1 Tax=Mycoplasmopsis pullorum TaxID=48003 RepID=UPI00111A4511|nr:hypothetical protein [Mycoplasmopsis pullorum]TNK83524.1 hypothetical protein C4M93_02250 [Mycoplasmopsis pullorum]TNK92091.1 hypothetical protein C4M96_02125 [Mycoplasmopsis pullorum]